jgi:hypothetical protein
VVVFLNSIYSQPRESFVGLLIILAGVPAFLYWKRKIRITDRNSVN